MRATAIGTIVLTVLLCPGWVYTGRSALEGAMAAPASSPPEATARDGQHIGILSPDEARRAARSRQRAEAKSEAARSLAVQTRATAPTAAVKTGAIARSETIAAAPSKALAHSVALAFGEKRARVRLNRRSLVAANMSFARARVMRRRLASRRDPRVGDIVPPGVALLPLAPNAAQSRFSRATAIDPTRAAYGAFPQDLPAFPDIDP